MLAIRSQENSLEIFELKDHDIRRLKECVMNLNGNFNKSRVPINDFSRVTFNIRIEFIDSKVLKLL